VKNGPIGEEKKKYTKNYRGNCIMIPKKGEFVSMKASCRSKPLEDRILYSKHTNAQWRKNAFSYDSNETLSVQKKKKNYLNSIKQVNRKKKKKKHFSKRLSIWTFPKLQLNQKNLLPIKNEFTSNELFHSVLRMQCLVRSKMAKKSIKLAKELYCKSVMESGMSPSHFKQHKNHIIFLKLKKKNMSRPLSSLKKADSLLTYNIEDKKKK